MTEITVVIENKNVKLTLLVNNNLQHYGVEPNGYFSVRGLEHSCWDNLEYFRHTSLETFTEGIEDEDVKRIEELGYPIEKVYKSVNKIIKKAKKIGLWFDLSRKKD